MRFTLSCFLLVFCNSLFSQVFNGKQIVWKPYSSDARVSFVFYSVGIIAGGVESAELLFDNKSSHKLLIKVSYSIIDNCGNRKNYSKSELVQGNERSKSSGAFFTGIDFSNDNCKTVTKFNNERTRTKIKDVAIDMMTIEDITEKEEQERLASEKRQATLRAEKEAAEKKRAMLANTTTSNPNQQHQTGDNINKQSSNVSSETPEQAKAKMAEENRRKYEEQQEKFAAQQKIDQQNSEQLATNIVDLGTSIFSLFQQNREEKEKRKALKDAENQKSIEEHRETINVHLQSANMGNIPSMHKVASAFLHLKDYNEARNWYKKAIENGDSSAFLGMAETEKWILSDGISKKKMSKNGQLIQLKTVIEWIQKAANTGNETAQIQLVLYYLNLVQNINNDIYSTDIIGNKDPNLKTLYDLLSLSASLKYWPWKEIRDEEKAIAIAKTAYYSNGNIVPLKIISNYYQFTNTNVSKSYWEGHAYYLKEDYSKANELIQKSASKYYPRALAHLAVIYHTGQGVETNEKLALNYAELAAWLDDIVSMEAFGKSSNQQTADFWNERAKKKRNKMELYK